MNTRQALDYLERIQTLGVKFGLDNVRTVLSSLGNPHRRYPSILVAGSNGKGSVCAMLTRILTLHGFKAGLYTSPHLVRYEERIRIGEELIPPRAFSRILSLLRSRIDRLISEGKLVSPPTHFEHLTCLALQYFAEQKVDMAVLEVGMGGRFDATNVVQPVLSVITTISPEHQKSLGDTLDAIAFEKAGIIKTGVPVVCGVEAPAAVRVIRRKARAQAAPLHEVFGEGAEWREDSGNTDFPFQYSRGDGSYVYSVSLPGSHQGKNAAVALTAALELSRIWQPLDTDRILAGLASTRWEGRLETFLLRPWIVLDGAHNREGALALKGFIGQHMPGTVVLVFATMQDKNIEELADILFPLASRVVLTRYPYSRAASPEEIARRVSARFRERLELEPDVGLALRRAASLAGEDGSVVVTGSLFLVGEVKKRFPDPAAVLA